MIRHCKGEGEHGKILLYDIITFFGFFVIKKRPFFFDGSRLFFPTEYTTKKKAKRLLIHLQGGPKANREEEGQVPPMLPPLANARGELSAQCTHR